MNKLTKRQQEVWDFIRDYTVDYGYSPTLTEIATHFEISPAAVSCMLKMLEHNKGIQRSRRNRSLRLLNPDGSFYDPAEDDELKIYIPAEIGTPVNLPENFRKMSPENTVFQMLDTQMSPMGICHNDLLEFSPAVAGKDGCFVAVRYGKRFFLRIFSANAEISRFSYAIPEHLTYCGDHNHCLITGILKRVIRKFD